MHPLFVLLIVLCSVGILLAFIMTLVGWLTHMSMTKSRKQPWGRGSYRDFIREFNKYNWSNEGWNGRSLWDRANNCEYHASIFTFNGIGMVMRTPFDYLMVEWFIRKYWDATNPRHDWSKNLKDLDPTD